MPEMRVSGRQRRSVGFPALTLLLAAGLLLAIAWVLGEIFPGLHLPF